MEPPITEYQMKVFLARMAREYIEAHVEDGKYVGRSDYMDAYQRLADEIKRYTEYRPEDLTRA